MPRIKSDYVKKNLPHLDSWNLSKEEKSWIAKVHRKSPEEIFFYWILERHKVFVKSKKLNEPAPWTKDPILRREFFTNPYRENDRVSIWYRKNIRTRLNKQPTERLRDAVLFATVAFRWFNKPEPTGELLRGKNIKSGLLVRWNETKACKAIQDVSQGGKQPVFTGAYMIKAGNGPKGCKIPNVCKAITNVWKERDRLIEVCKDTRSMEAIHGELVKFPFLGGFMAYEVACDLRYTKLLNRPADRLTWSNLGPGASRGLMRLSGQKIIVPKSGMKDARPKPPKNWMEEFERLMHKFNDEILPEIDGGEEYGGLNFKDLEMREVEHSLCEFDKYMRILSGDAKRTKRKYRKGV